MKIKAAWILIATGAVLLPLLVLQSSDAKRNTKPDYKPSPSRATRIVRSSVAKRPSTTLHPTQQPSPEKKVAPELAKSPAGDENSNDAIAVDQMSSAGRLAHLAATGKLARAIAKARIRAEARKTGRNFSALAKESGFTDLGDDSDDDGPAGGQAETSIAVDSTGQHIVIGINDTRGFSLSPVSVSGFAYSDDGGVTFTDGGQLPTPGVGVGSIPADTLSGTSYPQVFGDPEVKYIGGSTFIYFSICVKTIINPSLVKKVVQTMCVHRSIDNGHTWTGPYEVTSATNPNGMFSATSGNPRDSADKEFADVDPDTGRVLLSWSNFTPFSSGGVEISTTFSDDIASGNPPTWSTYKVVAETANDGQASVPRFAGNGSNNAYVVWRRFFAGNTNNVAFALSIDNGANWLPPVNLSITNFFTMDQVLGNDRVNTSPSLAVDNSTGPHQGNIYVVYANNNNHDGSDIAFQSSTTGGLTFSLPIVLDSRPGSDRAQWFPWVTVDKDSGRVYVFYYDQGIDTSGDLTETSYLFSDDGGITWSKPMPLTDRPFRAGHGNDTGQPNLGDYNQAVAQSGRLFVVWAGTEQKDFTDGLPSGSMTTPDIFVKNLPAASTKVSLSLGSVTFTDGNANGFIDAGEQVNLKLPLNNYVTNPLSAASVTGISGTLSSTTPGVTVTQPTSAYPDLAPGASANNATDYVIQLSSSFVPGTHIELALSVSSTQGSTTLLHRQSTGTPGATTIFSEDFDAVAPGSLPFGWATSHAGGANIVPWTTSNTFNPGSNGAFHQNAADGPTATNNTRFERLFSPVITVPTNAEYVNLDFDVKYDTEDDPSFNIQAFDGFLLRVTDFGPTSGSPSLLRSVLTEAYAEEFTTGSFKHHPKHFPRNSNTNYFQDMSAWAGDSQGVKHVHLKLPGMQGRFVQLRFEYTQDSIAICSDVRPGHTCGVLVDNIVMQSVVTVQADLSVSKTASPDPVTTGSNVTYTIVANNNGPSTANSVVVTDNLPSSVTFVSCASTGSGVCGGSGNNRTVTFSSLASGASETITLVATVDCSVANGTIISNTATISSSTPDNDSSNNSSTKAVTASNPPPLVTCNVATTTLWPPNHNLINVGLSASASDNCPGVTTSVAVYSDEDDVDPATSGDQSPDAKNIALGTLRLRSEREDNGNGRVYLIIVTETDSAGNVSHCCLTVTVPRSQSAANIASVNAQAAAALSFCQSNGTPPPGFFLVGDGPIVGSKQ